MDLTGNPAVPLVLVSIQFILHTAYCIPGRHNLQSFLEANSTQNYFLIACMLSFFVTICYKSAVFNILQQNVTHFDVGNGERERKWRKREEMERELGNVESQFLAISS